MKYTTVNEYKELTDSTESNSDIEYRLGLAEELVEKICERTFNQSVKTLEIYARGEGVLFLNDWLEELQEIKVNDVVIGLDNFVTGKYYIAYKDGKFEGDVKVKGNFGRYENAPDLLKDAIYRIAAWDDKTQKKYKKPALFRSESIDNYSYTIADGTKQFTGDTTVDRVLMKYRAVNVGVG